MASAPVLTGGLPEAGLVVWQLTLVPKPWTQSEVDAFLEGGPKAVLDALNGVAWVDDSQVSRLVVEKSYGSEGRTTVRIS